MNEFHLIEISTRKGSKDGKKERKKKKKMDESGGQIFA